MSFDLFFVESDCEELRKLCTCAVCSPCILPVVWLSGSNVAERSGQLLLRLRPEQWGCCIGLLSSVSRETHHFCFFAPDQTFGNSLSDVNPLGMCNSPVQLMKKSAEEYSSPQLLGVTDFQVLGKKLLYVLQDLSSLSSSSKTFYRYIWSAITMSVSS